MVTRSRGIATDLNLHVYCLLAKACLILGSSRRDGGVHCVSSRLAPPCRRLLTSEHWARTEPSHEARF